MEEIFRNHLQKVSSDSTLNSKQYFISQFRKLPYSIPNCHNLKNKLIVRYCIFRLRTVSRKKLNDLNKSNTNTRENSNTVKSSKTMAMHTYIK